MCLPTSIQYACIVIIINSSPTWITVLMYVWRLTWPPSSPAPLTLYQALVHPLCSWILLLSVCLLDELSRLIHLPDFLCLILLFDVTAGVYFGACYTGAAVVKSPTFCWAELSLSSQEKMPKICILCFALSAVIFSRVILLNCQLQNYKYIRQDDGKRDAANGAAWAIWQCQYIKESYSISNTGIDWNVLQISNVLRKCEMWEIWNVSSCIVVSPTTTWLC